jgi:putative transposase
MASTYLSLHYHVVFSTKHRTPSICETMLPRLHEYIGGIIEGLGGFPKEVGGVADHVHRLFGLKATATLSDFMRELKKALSVWMQEEGGGGLSGFGWQEGYAGFTISATARTAVGGYIRNQAEHHRKRSFREELIAMLEKAEVKYDEKYLD